MLPIECTVWAGGLGQRRGKTILFDLPVQHLIVVPKSPLSPGSGSIESLSGLPLKFEEKMEVHIPNVGIF